ncbi:carbonic anhydrase 12-like [Carassius carassius]|uniref:carbonic anhydrase 12-like n=1 Tax=Carassius carassius TaxID=217509 RepID=UPI0028691300|nr:carbonic anhydrase 12-like [Carassius carassius]
MTELTFSTVILLHLIFVSVSFSGAKWSYNGPDGERNWSSNYPFCGGAFQSPIDFQTHLLRYDSNLPPIQVQNYNLSTNEQLTLSNNGHSVQLSLPSQIYISSLPHRYSAAQLHFHWGSYNQLTGSEHTVNGKQFAGEMHVVHFNSDKYPNISMAVDKHDGLAVLGVFIEIGEFNPVLEKFFKYMNGIKYRDQKIHVPAFNIRALLPANLDEYYRYDGSLTTPPCYPSVLWTVFRRPVTISQKQFLALTTALYTSYAQESATVPLHGNYRKPQLTDNRVVLVSFKDGKLRLHGILSTVSPFQRKQVIQKLLVGDLADLPDEGLYQLLPKLSPQSGKDKKLKKTKKQGHWSQATQKQQWSKNKVPSNSGYSLSIGKNTPTPWYMGAFDTGKEMCFVSLEENVVHQLESYHAKSLMVEALREVVFPELNLRSYLHCRSDLDLQTIRKLIQERSRDEAIKLEESLAEAMLKKMRRSNTEEQKEKTNGYKLAEKKENISKADVVGKAASARDNEDVLVQYGYVAA